MFGFLKKKLQDAISKFSKDAKESVVEQKVEEESAIAEAKQEEERLLKSQERKVEEIPELPKEKAQHDAEERAKSAKIEKPVEKPAQKAEPVLKKPEKKVELKPIERPVEKPIKAEKPAEKPIKGEKPSLKTEQKPVERPALPITKPVEPKPELKRVEKPIPDKSFHEDHDLKTKPVEVKAPEKPKATEKPVPKEIVKEVVKEKPLEKVPEPAKPAPVPQERTAAPEAVKAGEKQAAPQKAGFFKSLFGKKPKETEQPKPAEAAVPESAKPEPAKHVVEPEKPVEPKQRSAPKIEPKPAKPAERAPRPAAPEQKAELPAPQVVIEQPEVPAAPVAPPITTEPEEKRGFFARLGEAFTKKTLSEEKFEEIFWELEVVLLENNVAVEVIEKIKEDLKRALTAGKVSRLGVEELVALSLKQSVEEVLSVPSFDLVERIKSSDKRPYVICFIGVNGSGKTTTLAKVANMFQNEDLSVVMAASDTFRAAAIDQLKEHADKLGIKLISQGYGADPAAVAYDAIEHAKARNIDVVMIDTAGRLHSNTNLMAELQKVVRVAKPDLKIFIGESITGNDCVEQAKEFDRIAGIDAIILSKADVDEKGGAALSVSYVTKKPILFLGVGQSYGDLKRFDREEVVGNLGL